MDRRAREPKTPREGNEGGRARERKEIRAKGGRMGGKQERDTTEGGRHKGGSRHTGKQKKNARKRKRGEGDNCNGVVGGCRGHAGPGGRDQKRKKKQHKSGDGPQARRIATSGKFAREARGIEKPPKGRSASAIPVPSQNTLKKWERKKMGGNGTIGRHKQGGIGYSAETTIREEEQAAGQKAATY